MPNSIIEVGVEHVTVEVTQDPQAVVHVLPGGPVAVGVDVPEVTVEVVAAGAPTIEVSGSPIVSASSVDNAALQAHVDAAEPHPAYDDMPSLALLFENGLV